VAAPDLHLIPRPAHVEEVAGCSLSVRSLIAALRRAPADAIDDGARENVIERW
jgi:hypothetical protein